MKFSFFIVKMVIYRFIIELLMIMIFINSLFIKILVKHCRRVLPLRGARATGRRHPCVATNTPEVLDSWGRKTRVTGRRHPCVATGHCAQFIRRK